MRDRQRHLSLRRAPQASSPTASEGLYNPLNTTRQIFAGAGDSSAVVQMTSWHEMFHAFLNASTCHGNAMIFAGALANAGKTAFLPMVESMIDAALLTHETYATVAAVSAVGRGRIEPGLLADYRDYLPLLEGFMRLFPARVRPLTSLVAFSACARAAMQTEIYGTLRATPVEKWPDIDLAAAGLPDERFAQLMAPNAVSRVIAAIDAYLAPKNVRLADGGEALEFSYWRAAPTDDLDRMNEAAFAACRGILAACGQSACAFDAQQRDLSALIAMVEAYGGETLRTRFHAPASPEAHADALLVDFRSEELVLSRTPLPARVFQSQTHDTLDRFVLGAPGRRYIQLIAMPEAKARAIYSPIDGRPDALADGLLVGLRRRWRPNDGGDAIVEILQLQPDDLARLHQPEKFDPYLVTAMSALSAPTWFGDWLQSPACPLTRMAILLDEDPFDLLQQHAARGAHLEITYLRASADSAAHTEVLAIMADDQPGVVYFTPCTSPFRRAVSEYARLRLPRTRFSADAFAPHMTMLQTLSAHVLREEPRFGNRFWLR